MLAGLRRVAEGWRSFRSTIVWRLLARQNRWLWALLVTAVGAFGGAVGTASTIRDLVDQGVLERSAPVSEFVGILVFLAFWTFAWGFALRQVIARIGYHLEFELRIWLYERLQSTRPDRLDALATGQMVTRAMTDLLLLQLLVVVLPAVAVVAMVLVGIGVLMVAMHPLLAMVAFAALPANIAIIYRIRRRLWGMSWVALDRRARVTTLIDETVRGARVVKAFGREDHERSRLAEAARRAYAASMTRIRLVARYDLLLAFIPTLSTALLIYFGVREGLSGRLTVGDLLLFFMYSLVFTGFARVLDEIQSAWQFAKTGAGRIFELIAFAEPADLGSGEPLPADGPGLVLEGASVRISGHPILEDVTVDVAPGELLVVTGPPRAGKTTLARAISGAQEVASGAVTVDGVAVGDLDPVLRRRAIRVVGEDPFLFSRSVRSNLLLGADPDTSEARLWAALDAAGARQVVEEMPFGLDTVLGDRGLTVSGGQRQRLALACALVEAPRVLVLDDALSAVDPALEVTILRQVRAFAPSTAVVAMARRPGASEVADRLLELPEPLPGAPRRPRAAGSLAVDGPYDLLLAGIVATLPPDRDEPVVSDDEATRDEAPSVPGILRPHARHVRRAALLLLGFTVAGLVPTWMIQVGLDGVNEGRMSAGVLAAVVTTLAAAAVAGLTYAFRIEAKKVEEGAGYLMRRRTFGRLTRLGVDYYDRELPGKVAARVVHDLDQIALFLETGVYELATAICVLVASFIVIAAWEPSVALAISGVIPVLLALTLLQLGPATRAYERARAALGEVVGRLQEDFAGRYVIEASGAEEASRAEFVRLAFDLRQARKRAATIANSYIEAMQLVASLAAAGLLATAANRVFEGALSVGGMVALQLFLVTALAPIPAMSGVLQRYLAARASFRTLSEPFAAPIRPQVAQVITPCLGATGDIVLTGVTFTYPDTIRRVLEAVDLEIPAGATVAVVGPTGAGKSSIAKLVARVYDPDGGTVTVGGTDIRSWELASYRRRIGIVPQDGFCFRGTVADNIAYGRPDATRAEVEAAAAAVGALDAVLGLPGGLDGRVEEEGRNLTAAQTQLISLARAWLTEPDILILDEATSSLDPETEQHVLAATRAMACTTIMVTHRLPVAQSADLVVVVAGGRVVETGKPASLRRRRASAYRALWEAGPEVEPQAEVADPDLVPLAALATTNGDRAPDHRIITESIQALRDGSLGAAATGNGSVTASSNGARSAATAALTGKVIGETDEELATFLDGAGGARAVAATLLEGLREAVDPAVVGNLAVAIEISGGDETHRWVLRSATDAEVATLTLGDDDAALTMRLAAVDLLRVVLGQLDPIEGIMEGRLALEGDLEQVARLSSVFATAGAGALP